MKNFKTEDQILQEICKDGKPYWERSDNERKEISDRVDKIFVDQFDEETKKRMAKKDEVFEEVKRLESEAMDKLNEACKLLDNLGVGYNFKISPVSQPYNASVEGFAKFIGQDLKDVDLDELSNIAEIFGVFVDTCYECGGWQDSAIC